MTEPAKIPRRYGHCQVCRRKNELRRIGPIEAGARLWVCFGCVLAEGYDVLRQRLREGIADTEARR